MSKDTLLIICGAVIGALLSLLICYFCCLPSTSDFVPKSDYVQDDGGFDGPIDDFIGDDNDFLDDSKDVELPWIYFNSD